MGANKRKDEGKSNLLAVKEKQQHFNSGFNIAWDPHVAGVT